MPPLFSYQAVIFDLDGTLIDSAPGILRSFEDVLRKTGIQPRVPLDESIIGPPLRQTLVNLAGIADDTELNTLVELFKDSYDSEGHRATRVYEGVEELLTALVVKQVPMAIATNKRMIPTRKIVKLLGWEHCFRMIGTLDSTTPSYPNKAVLIRTLLTELAVDPANAVYIGDKPEDGAAAAANRMPFIAVGWGYGEWHAAERAASLNYVESPDELLE